MRVNKYLVPAVMVIALLGSVLVAKATGRWIVSGKQMIDVENMTSVNEIKGWMTLEQVSTGFQIPQAELYQLLGIPREIPFDTPLKEMEKLIAGFEVSAVRDAVAQRIGEGYQAPETHEPEQAATPTPESTPTAAVEHAPRSDGSGDGTGPTPLPQGQVLAASEIKGRHTLQEIASQCQVPLAELLEALDLPESTGVHTSLKDLVSAGNIGEVEQVRDAVTKLQQGR